MEREKKPLHIGMCIKTELERQGRTSVWLAKALGCHRTNIYKIYDKRSLDTSILLRISQIMGYDFFQLYSDSLKHEQV